MFSTFTNTELSPGLSNEDVLSPLTFPSASPADANVFQFPNSFELPFPDPDMEPVPLGPSISPVESVSSSPSLSKTDISFLKQASSEPDHAQSLYALLFKGSVAGTKRNSSDLVAELSTEMGAKRQRTMPESTNDETVMRFRPYQDHQWRGMYQKLVQYKFKNGHCCVPHSYEEDPMLARWVKRQRYQYKKFEDNDPTSTMTVHRIQELDSIGFVWHSHASAWQTKLNELTTFKHQMGHCNVPSNYTKNPSLSAWTRCQRRQYRLWRSGCSSTMTAERYELLKGLGFSFENPKPTPSKN